MYHRHVSLISTALSLGVLAACSAGGANNNTSAKGSDATAQGTPPIYVEQTLVLRRHGEPAEQQNYQRELANCGHLSVPTTPLDSDVVGRLGRTYYGVWYEGARMAIKADEWKYAVKNVCEFSPVHQVSQWIVTSEGTTTLDITHQIGSFDANVRFVRQSPAAPEATGGDNDDEALRAAVSAQLQKQGQGNLMAEDAGSGTSAGQPCRQVKDATSEACIWTGGAQWGFGGSGGQATSAVTSRIDSIELWERPVDGGDGLYLSTQKMTVGRPIDEAVFKAPPGIEVKRG